MAWEFNGFSGYDNSLLMYDRYSTASHSCDPNCASIVLMGLFKKKPAGKPCAASFENEVQAAGTMKKGDVFEQRYAGLALQARREMKCGEEITFNYCLTAEDMAQDFQHRRSQLNLRGWKFQCDCSRCVLEIRELLTGGKAFPTGEVEEEHVGKGEMLGLFEDM